MEQARVKIKVQSYVLALSVLLLVGKFTAYGITNSAGVLSDAIESIVNVVAGVIALYSIREASRPKDKHHPFGHGKIELLSASAEAVMIVIAGVILMTEGARRIFVETPIARLDVGIWVVAIAGGINFIAGTYSVRVGKKHRSMALIAAGRHLQSDAYSSVGLVIGLVLLYFTKHQWIDGTLAIIFGLVIVWTGVRILKETAANLTDKADTQVLSEISKALSENRKPQWIDVHNVKSIRYGNSVYVDCDVTLPWFYTIGQGHEQCDQIKEILNRQLPGGVQVTVHTDPCAERYCSCCMLESCGYRKASFEKLLSLDLRELIQNDEEREQMIFK